ncbi:exonuclease SbcCD subunit D [Candidatus Hydrogenedentota bacterium]
MSFTLMHLADIHLGAPFPGLGDKAEQRKEDLLDTFGRALETASVPDLRVDLVIIAGDLFDSLHPDRELVANVKRQVSELGRNGIPVLIVPGTHDSACNPDSVFRKESFPGATVVLHSTVDRPLRFVSSDGTPAWVYVELAENDRKPFADFRPNQEEGVHIGVLHGSVIEREGLSMRDADNPVTLDDLHKTSLDYIALGHYHNFRDYGVSHPTVVYPGTLEGRKFGENGERYLVTVEFDGGEGKVSQTFFNRRSYEEREINLSNFPELSEEGLAQLISEKASSEILLRCTLTGGTSFKIDAESLTDRIKDSFFHVEIVDDTHRFTWEDIEAMGREPGVRGLFVRKMRERIEKVSEDEKKSLVAALNLGLERMS